MSKENVNKSVAPYSKGVSKYYSPLNSWDLFHNEFDSLVDSMFNWAWSNPTWVTNRNYRLCDVKDNTDNYTISVELPGYKRSEVKLEVVGNTLQLTAENTKGKYVKSWSLSDSDLEKVTSKLEDGVLNVTIPKLPSATPKVIDIQ